MERTPIKDQSRFGPAQSRAQVFSIFSPTVPDMSKADAFRNLSDIAGMAATYSSEKEQRKAVEDRDAGMREYAAGLVQDGQRIRNGELEPIESRYYMAGVEMGQGRRRGREVWAEFSRWAAENPRPGLDADEDYNTWVENGLAAAQEALGYDPGSMSEAELGEYSAVVNQVRQRDSEEFVAQLNREAVQGQVEGINSDIAALGDSYDPEDPAALYTEAANILASARANGLNLDATRREMLTQFANMAEEAQDLSILENVPQGVLHSASNEEFRQNLIESTRANIDRDNWRGQGRIHSGIQELIQAGDLTGAQNAVDAAYAADSISVEMRDSLDDRIFRETRARQRAAASGGRASQNARVRSQAAVTAFDANGGSSGTTYRDANGNLRELSPSDVALEMQNFVMEGMGGDLTPEVVTHLSGLSIETGMAFPAVSNLVNNAFSDISPARLMGQNLTPAQQNVVSAVMSMPDEALAVYITDESQLAAVRAARSIGSTGQYSPEEALGRGRLMQSADVSPQDVQRWAGRSGSSLDWGSFGGGGNGFFSFDPDGIIYFRWPHTGETIVGPALERSRNLDADDEHGRTAEWSLGIGENAARIANVFGEDAAREYVQSAVERTMVVNRAPVRPVGLVGGYDGGTFIESLLEPTGMVWLAPELEFAHGASWWNQLWGRTGEWNPNDQTLRDTFIGHINVHNVEGGLLFELEGASRFIPTAELNVMYNTWRAEQLRLNADWDQDAFDNTRDIHFVPPPTATEVYDMDRVRDRLFR